MNVPSATHSRRLTRTLLAALSAIIGVLLLAGTWAAANPATSAAAAVTARHDNGPKPTIVLVHGARRCGRAKICTLLSGAIMT